MSDTGFDVVIAAYLIPDLAEKDLDALVRLVGDKQLKVDGVARVTNDADGNVTKLKAAALADAQSGLGG